MDTKREEILIKENRIVRLVSRLERRTYQRIDLISYARATIEAKNVEVMIVPGRIANYCPVDVKTVETSESQQNKWNGLWW